MIWCVQSLERQETQHKSSQALVPTILESSVPPWNPNKNLSLRPPNPYIYMYIQICIYIYIHGAPVGLQDPCIYCTLCIYRTATWSPCGPTTPEYPKQWTFHCLYSLFWDIGPVFWEIGPIHAQNNFSK